MPSRSYAEILSSCLGEESPLNKYVQEIQAAAHRSAKMTNQLLAYSRKQMVQPEVIDLNEVMTVLAFSVTCRLT